MTATDELRRMLDERGVKWMPVAWSPKRETFYHAANGVGFCADEYTDGVKIYTDSTITPEQAVEATLGSCNCSNSERTSDSDATAERRGDAVEVVRCGDCKYVTDEGYGCKYFSHYEQGASYRWEDVPAEVEPDGFCAWGETEEGEI